MLISRRWTQEKPTCHAERLHEDESCKSRATLRGRFSARPKMRLPDDWSRRASTESPKRDIGRLAKTFRYLLVGQILPQKLE
jgi:hypothetical protein